MRNLGGMTGYHAHPVTNLTVISVLLHFLENGAYRCDTNSPNLSRNNSMKQAELIRILRHR